MNRQSDRQLKKFAAIFLILLLATAASFGATAALTLQVNGEGTISSLTNGQQLLIGKTYSIEAHDKADFTFTGWTGSQTNSKSKLTFTVTNASGLTFTANFADKKNPTLTIATPPGSKGLTSDTIVVTGTARDNAAVTNVSYSLNGEDWQPAMTGNGWSNWWATVTLNPNTNTLRAYAVDSSGNISKTEKVNMTLIAVPPSLAGMTMTATPDGINFNLRSFGPNTFSEVWGDDMAVGSYTFKKASDITAKLSLKYNAPPVAGSRANDATLVLQFETSTNGSYTENHHTINFTLSSGTGFTNMDGSMDTNLVPASLSGATLILLSDDTNETDLGFPSESASLIVDNGHMFDVANPLVISLSTPYAGQIGDRVSVPFIQLKNISGQFVQVGMPVFVGTVVGTATDTNANTVTILFDKPTFISRTELFAPVGNSPVNILTFEYTNLFDGGTNGTGTFIFTNYSPVGSLLQLNEAGENNFLVLTFTNDTDSGNYYEESFNTASNTPAVETGSFSLTLPPQITAQPASTNANIGDTVTFSVTASGSPTLTYQWQMNGTNLADITTDWGSIILGSTSNVLTLMNVTNNDAGNYQVIVTNDFGSVTSSVVTLTIEGTNSSPPGP